MEKLPFDLEKALNGEPVVTGDGKPVTNIRLTESRNNPLRGTVDGQNTGWHKDGIFTIHGKLYPDMSLYMLKQ